MNGDTYYTIAAPSEAVYTQKRSKFIAFAFPVQTVEEVKPLLDQYQKKYYDARHLCYAYRLGTQGETTRMNDNGEPSGTAGKPIFGQLLSSGLTNVLVMVVRYFGGVKLGTSGLIVAYRQAAADALSAAPRKECTIEERLSLSFAFSCLNDVMRVVKDLQPKVLSSDYENNCSMVLQIRRSLFLQLKERLEKIPAVSLTIE